MGTGVGGERVEVKGVKCLGFWKLWGWVLLLQEDRGLGVHGARDPSANRHRVPHLERVSGSGIHDQPEESEQLGTHAAVKTIPTLAFG